MEEKKENQAVPPKELEKNNVGDGHVRPKNDDIEELTTLHERAIATLSYFGPLAIVPFYLNKESKFCRFHGKQGITLAIIFFLAQFASVLDFIMDLFSMIKQLMFSSG